MTKKKKIENRNYANNRNENNSNSHRQKRKKYIKNYHYERIFLIVSENV